MTDSLAALTGLYISIALTTTLISYLAMTDVWSTKDQAHNGALAFLFAPVWPLILAVVLVRTLRKAWNLARPTKKKAKGRP